MDRIARRRRANRGPPRRDLSSVPYLPGLDGMRALAVIAVMVYHANSSWLPGGFMGVEVFFVISGYLITLLLIGEHERSGRVSLREFYLRRARRLLPALFTMLILLAVYTALFKRDELGRVRGDVLAGLGYVSNWFQIWVQQGYTTPMQFAPLRHLWSLAVEEQFYLCWPLVMIGLIRLRRGRLPATSTWLVLAAVAVTAATAVLYHPGRIQEPARTPEAFWHVGERWFSKTDTLYLSTFTRSTGLLIGGALAMLWRPKAVMRGPLRSKGLALDGLAVIGLLALVVLSFQLHLVTTITDGGDAIWTEADPWLFRGGFLAVDLAAMLMIAAVTHRAAWSGVLLGNPILRWVGTRSYGMYLYHWPIYQIIREVTGVGLSVREFALAMVATAVITELSYRLVEMPIRKRQVGVWLSRLRVRVGPIGRRAIGFGAAATIMLAGFAGVSMATATLEPTEFEQSLQQGEEAVTDLSATLGEQDPQGPIVPPAPPRTTTTSSSTLPLVPPTSAPPSSAVDTSAVETSEPLTSPPPDSTEPATTEADSTVAEPTAAESTAADSTEPASTTDDTKFVPGNPISAADTNDTAPSTDEPTSAEEAPASTEEAPASTDEAPASTQEAPTSTTEATTATTIPSTTTIPPTTLAPTTVATTTTLAPTTTAVPPVVMAIGDSVMLGAAENLAARGVIVDATVSRQMTDVVPLVQQLAAEGRLGDVVVVHLGTNGPFSEETMTAFFDALAGVPKVIVLTVHADRGWVARNNELIMSLPSRYANIDLIDWSAAVGGCPGDCLYEDGIHLPPDGRRYYAQLIFDHAGI